MVQQPDHSVLVVDVGAGIYASEEGHPWPRATEKVAWPGDLELWMAGSIPAPDHQRDDGDVGP